MAGFNCSVGERERERKREREREQADARFVALQHTRRCLLCFFRSDLVNDINPLNAELNPICYLLALLGAHHFFHVSRIRVKSLSLRLLMSYIYIYIYIYIYDFSSLRVNLLSKSLQAVFLPKTRHWLPLCLTDAL